MGSVAGRVVHVIAAGAGSELAAELVPALRASGRLVHVHRLAAPASAGPEDEGRLREELRLAREAARASLADGGTLLLADERGALVVPELMRLLLDEQFLGWDEAWARACALTVSRFGSPGTEPSRPFLSVSFLESDEPRLLEILFEINRRHLDAVETRFPGDGGRRRRLSLFREGEARRLRPGSLAVLASAHADVARPWEGPAAEILADFAVLRGSALSACPTPVFAPAFITEGNPALAELLSRTLGETWATDPEAFARLEALAFDASFRGDFRRMRRTNRERLASFLQKAAGIETDADALVDLRLGTLGGPERPLLNVLGLVREHLRLTAGGRTPPAPRTAIFARPAATTEGDERTLRLLRSVADAINADERARKALRVAVLLDCDDAAARLLAAGADLVNQPGTAGSGAAGARALGLGAGGAVTLGTRDGTVRELEAAVGAENLFLFGLGPLETHAWRAGQVYRPQDVYAIDPLVRLSLDALVGSRYAPAAGAFDWVKAQLFDPHDPWLVLADLGAYVHRQDEALAEFADPRTFTEKAILTLARTRRFWVERLE